MIGPTALSAKGAKCKSLGHRPKRKQAVVTALKARNIPGDKKVLLAIRNSHGGYFVSRTFSAWWWVSLELAKSTTCKGASFAKPN
jgi:hypothetical protein